ncbi:MAG: hypothetical protein AAFX92_10600, partial [Pseudomonadota bacterium]
QGLPNDRRFAITHKASRFDPAHPAFDYFNGIQILRCQAFDRMDANGFDACNCRHDCRLWPVTVALVNSLVGLRC